MLRTSWTVLAPPGWNRLQRPDSTGRKRPDSTGRITPQDITTVKTRNTQKDTDSVKLTVLHCEAHGKVSPWETGWTLRGSGSRRSLLLMIQGEEERREQSRDPWRWVVTFDDGNLCPNNLAILMCSTRWLFTWSGKTSTDDYSHNLVKQSLKTASVASHSWHNSHPHGNEDGDDWYVQLFSPTTPKGSVRVLTTHLEAEASEQLSAWNSHATPHFGWTNWDCHYHSSNLKFLI